MPDADIVSAARGVADVARLYDGPAAVGLYADIVALLPVLDAVAAEPDADKVDRWRAAQERDTYPATTTGTVGWSIQTERIKGALALADAERATERTTRIASIFDRWSRADHVRLHAGEMTAQEMRSAQAVLGAVRREVEGVLALAESSPPR